MIFSIFVCFLDKKTQNPPTHLYKAEAGAHIGNPKGLSSLANRGTDDDVANC